MSDHPAIPVFLSVVAVAAVVVAIRRQTLANWLPAACFSCMASYMWFHQAVFIFASLVFSVLWFLAAFFRSSRT
jgi:hypothetical protein